MAGSGDRRALESARDLSRALEELGTEVATKVGVAANRRAAKILQSRLVAVAPYDPAEKKRGGNDYGHLRENIKVSRQKAAKQHHIIHLVTTGRAFWGRLVELGTAKMRAHPWFRPTWESMEDEMRKAQADELRIGIDRAARKAARKTRRG